MDRKRKMKVAIILPSFDIGGTENMVANLVKYIDKNKFEILVISLFYPKGTYIQKNIEDTGVNIFYAMKGKIPIWRVFFKVYRVLCKFNPDLIHSNMYAFAFAVPYLFLHKIILLHTIHNKPKNEFKDKYKKVISFLYKIQKAIPVAISDIVQKEMVDLYPQLNKIEKVYNPVETEKYYTKREIKTTEKITFINVARFMRQKNHILLLEAFAQAKKELPSISLMLVGDGELREELEQKAKELGIEASVIFTGQVKNVSDYLAKADVFVLSSDYEGLPLSCLEAMASGLPVIATDVGGLRDIVTNNGVLVAAGDKNALAEQMTEMALDHKRRFQMGIYSIQNVKKYDSSKFVKKYEHLYYRYGRI